MKATTHNAITDAILMFTDVTEADLETMLGRVLLFQKAFKKIDVDGNQKLSLNEAKLLISTYVLSHPFPL